MNGYYPDYAGNKYVNKRTSEPMKVRRLPLTADGKPKFICMALTGFVDTLEFERFMGAGMARVMDDLSACLVQYADNGKLLPRGACSGGYSFIMIGCPGLLVYW